MTVLDASALLAYLLDEAGAEVVEASIADDASIGTVNLAEVLAKLADAGEDPTELLRRIEVLPLEFIDFDAGLALESALLRSVTSPAGLSLGDRACLGLGRARGDRVLTADGAWAGLVPDIEVEVIR